MKKLFKAGAFIIACAGITLFAMEKKRKHDGSPSAQPTKTARIQTIKVLTSDGQEVAIPRHLALQSSLIKNTIGDTNESDAPLPLPNVDKASLDIIIAILAELDNYAGQDPLKRSDGQYIAQRIQPLINNVLNNQTQTHISAIIRVAQFLDLDYIVNGAIRQLVQLILNRTPQATLAGIVAHFTLDIDITQNSALVETLKPLFFYQYHLVKNNIPELSIADYIAIHGMPQIGTPDNAKALSLNGRGITSLDGLGTIKNIQTVQSLSLDNNNISTIAPNAFAGLTNLRILYLHRNTISSIAPNAFAGVANLEELYLHRNTISSIAANAFAALTNLKILYLFNSSINSIAANAFAGLTNLEALYLHYNNISSIAPNTFAGLTKLEELYLMSNPISASIQQNINQFKQDQGLPADTHILP